MKTKIIIRIIIMLGIYYLLRYEGGDIGQKIFYPIQLLVTFLHEMGHAIGAIVTGGSVINFQINQNGSGFVTTSGGSRSFILMSGYLGSALFGNLLFLIGARSKVIVKPLMIFLAISMIIAGTLWFNSLFTTGFLFLFAMCILLLVWKTKYSNELLMFLGLATILYIIQDFNVGPQSDLKKYAEINPLISAQGWMYIWLIIALALFIINLWILFKITPSSDNHGEDDFMNIKTL